MTREVLCQSVSNYVNKLALKKIDSNWEILNYWIPVLGLTEYAIKTVRISIFQVSDENGRVANSLVGVVTDHRNKTACIYHTRRLREEDILHELLHIKFPLLSEGSVNIQVKKIIEMRMNNRQINFIESAQIDKFQFLVHSSVGNYNGIYTSRSGRNII